jgi:predicted permease
MRGEVASMLALEKLRLVARRLRRAPAFSLAAVLTLALGIGATTAVFSLVKGVLLQPLPYDEADRLVDLSHTLAISGITRVEQSDATYLHYRRANRVFSGVGVYRATSVNLGALAGAGGAGVPQRVTVARVSAGTFGLLRVAPWRGRVFTENEDLLGATPVVLIGQRLWERDYGADPLIVGRRVEVDGVAREIVGVMPERFRFPDATVDLWLPIGIDPANTASAAFDYRGIARLRDGVSLAAATADLQRLLPEVPVAFPGRLTAEGIRVTQMRAAVRPLRDVVVGDVGRVLWVILGAVAFVLLVACANVANLFLVRAEERQHELAVRRALGAGNTAVVMEFLSEAVVLAAVGGVLGLALAGSGVGLLRSLEAGIDVPRLDEVGIDAMVLAAAAGTTLLSALLVSVLPALRSASLTVSSLLSDAGRSATTGRRRHRARQALVVAQVALALTLLAGAGLMARSFARLRSVEPGFDAAGVHTFRAALPAAVYPSSQDLAQFIVRALDELAALPGIGAAGVTTKLPLDVEARRDTAIFVEDRPLQPGMMPNIHQVSYVSPGYFRALNIPLLDGRVFDPPDPDRARREVIVSRALAARYWSGGHGAVGRRVRLTPLGAWYTVIGVAGDVRGTALEQQPDETIYLPLVTTPRDLERDTVARATWTPRELAFVVRGRGSVTATSASAESVMRRVAPDIPLYRPRALGDVVAGAAARTAFTLLLLGLASAVALSLGAVGIYGVISYVVSMRAREIALRLALGAQPAEVRRMVSRQALGVAAIGIAVGLVGATAVTRLLAALLFGVSPTDPPTLLGAAALLVVVALVASWLPARRAAGVDPAQALRAD